MARIAPNAETIDSSTVSTITATASTSWPLSTVSTRTDLDSHRSHERSHQASPSCPDQRSASAQYPSGRGHLSDDMLERLLSCMGYCLEIVRRPVRQELSRSPERSWEAPSSACHASNGCGRTRAGSPICATWTVGSGWFRGGDLSSLGLASRSQLQSPYGLVHLLQLVQLNQLRGRP